MIPAKYILFYSILMQEAYLGEKLGGGTVLGRLGELAPGLLLAGAEREGHGWKQDTCCSSVL